MTNRPVRKRAVALALLLAGAVACSPAVRTCAKGTFFVAVRLSGQALDATELVVDITVGSGAPVRTTLTHQAGVVSGGIEIEFPRGYPTGQPVTVTITALQSGTPVATDTKTASASGTCVGLSLTLTGASLDDLSARDQASVGGDAGEDLASPLDLTGADLAGVDLVTPTDGLLPVFDMPLGSDLLSTFDLPAPPEDCFNNIDDDGDGFIDCADPDCTGGATPKAMCVPKPGGSFALGVRSASCPSVFTSSTPLYSQYTGPTCSASSCNCDPGMDTGRCYGNFDYGYALGDTLCTNTFMGFNTIYDTCSSVSIPTGSGHKISLFWQETGGACSGSGPSNKTASSYTTEQLCQRTYGGGCGATKVCAPSAPKYCAAASGGVIGGCPSGFVQQADSTYYDSLTNDDGTCVCGCSAIGGKCDGTQVLSYSSGSCAADAVMLSTGCSSADVSSVTNVKTPAPTTAGSCTSPIAFLSKYPTLNSVTLCCTP